MSSKQSKADKRLARQSVEAAELPASIVPEPVTPEPVSLSRQVEEVCCEQPQDVVHQQQAVPDRQEPELSVALPEGSPDVLDQPRFSSASIRQESTPLDVRRLARLSRTCSPSTVYRHLQAYNRSLNGEDGKLNKHRI